MRLRLQLRQQLEGVAQCNGRVRLSGEEAVIEAAAIAQPVALRVKGQTRHEHQSRRIVGLRAVVDRLRDAVGPGGDARRVVQPQKAHVRFAIDLRHGDALAERLRLPDERQRAHLLIVAQVGIERPGRPEQRVGQQLRRQIG